MTIFPFVGFGPVKFGMSPEQVRSALNEPHQAFMKTPSSLLPTDAFDSVGVHVYYDREAKCEAIEIFRPGRATYDEIDLLELT